jgi:hypothetical protein
MIKRKHPEFGTWLNHPCGKCIACRINKRSEWTTRMILQSRLFDYMYYITLTYRDENLPENGNLEPKDLKNWMLKLRSGTGIPFKYYAVGEYGNEPTTLSNGYRTKGWRPHYHIVIWSQKPFKWRGKVGAKLRSQSKEDSDFNKYWFDNTRVESEQIVVGDSIKNVARYVSGYVVKKWTSEKNIELLNEKYGLKLTQPEFSRMSKGQNIGGNKTYGIGLDPKIIDPIAKSLLKYDKKCPKLIRIGGKLHPLDRRMIEHIEKTMGKDKTRLQKALECDRIAVKPVIAKDAFELEIIDKLERREDAYKAQNEARKTRRNWTKWNSLYK